jgi:hypothetical protein
LAHTEGKRADLKQLIEERRLPYFLERRIGRKAVIQRYLSGVFRSALASPPLTLVPAAGSEIEVVSLLGRRDLCMFLVALKSLALYSPFRFSATIVSDGSLSIADKAVLAEHLRNIKIYEPDPEQRRAGCLALLSEEARRAIAQAARQIIYITKLFDFYDATTSPTLIVLDADILFHRRFEGSELQVSDNIPLRYNRDHDHSFEDRFFCFAIEYMRLRGFSPPIRDLNSGFMVLQRAAFDYGLMADYVQWICENRMIYHRISQDTWNVVGAKYGAEPLSSFYLVGSRGEAFRNRALRQRAIMTHYVGTARYRWRYALEYARRARDVLHQINRHGFEPL